MGLLEILKKIAKNILTHKKIKPTSPQTNPHTVDLSPIGYL